MTKATVKAPVGYHFMVHSDGRFYLMKTASTGYLSHSSGGYISQLSIEMEVKASHTENTSTQTAATSTTQSTTRTTRTATTASSRRTTTTRSTGGGGGY